jgi:glycosyltransferase involved in cell wall biosynthesis
MFITKDSRTTKKLKIVLFQFYSQNPCPDYDEMGNYFIRQGHDVTVTHMTSDKKLLLDRQGDKIELDIFPWKIRNALFSKFFARRLAFIIFMVRIRKLIKDLKPDIFVVATSELMYLSLLPVNMPANVTFIYDIRQIGFTPGSSLKVKIKNTKAKINMWFISQLIYDHTCFAFEAAAKSVLGKNWINKKASVMEVGVNQKFLTTPRTIKKTGRDKLQLVYIGSLARVRKLEFIIDSVSELINKTQNFHITFIGPDPENYYHNYVEVCKLKDYISVLDPVPYQDVPILLDKYHVAIAYVPEHPDWHFQPTLKVKEYRALGMPIIATDNLPNRVFVKEFETGLFFRNNKEDFCRAILSLNSDDILLNKLTNNALVNRSGPTWDDSAKEYEKLFESLVRR